VERTFRSICNQTDQNFKVIAVCHEKPKVNFEHTNIIYIEVPFDPPIPRLNESNESITRRRELDKGYKLKAGVKYALEMFDTDYVMTVDSDDFISNRITEFVNKSNIDTPGWFIKNGYLHFEKRSFLFATFKFNYLCGSSVIVKPELFDYFFNQDSLLFFDHRLTTLNKTINLKPLPFYGGIYSMANGENHLMHLSNIKRFNNHQGWLSIDGLNRIFTKLKNYRFRFISKKLQREFRFYF